MGDTPLLILLPGMEGTGTLFRPFLDCLPDNIEALVVSYPAQTRLNYQQLEELVRRQLPRGRPYRLLAESFSGPISLRIGADEGVGDLRGIVLISSFASYPLGSIGLDLARLPLGLILRFPPPKWLLQLFLLAPSCPAELFRSVRSAIAMVDSDVMAGRIQDTLTVDCEDALRKCRVPVTAIFSENDRLLGSRAEKHFRQCCPSAIIDWVQAPHLLLQSSPWAAVEVLRKHRLL